MSRIVTARLRLGMIGGTGTLGRGLARRWLRAGYAVTIGSRDLARAWACADMLVDQLGQDRHDQDRLGQDHPGTIEVSGADYAETAATSDILVLTVPFAGQAAVLDTIRPAMHGQLLIDTTVPLMPSSTTMVRLPEIGSAAVAAQERLGAAARVVSAFHNVPAVRLEGGNLLDCDVLVFGDAPADRETAITLVEAAGMRGVHGGPHANSLAAEALPPVLIGINRHYSIGNAGLRITGLG